MRRLLDGKPIIMERLNPNVGFYYTVDKILFRRRSKHQLIEVMQTPEFGLALLLDGVMQVVEKNDYQYHETIVHPALLAHPNPRRVLVIGAGDGGVLREVLKHRCVEEVHLAEIDSDVIACSKRYLRAVCKGAFDDPRVRISITDGRDYVEAHQRMFDVVIMDITDPLGPSRMLYTREFFTAVARAFRAKRYGVFAMHSESPVTRPRAVASILRTLRSVFRYVRPFFVYVQMYATLWSITVCSNGRDVRKIKAAHIDRALKDRGVYGLRQYNGTAHYAMQVIYPYLRDAIEGPSRLITDARPDFPDMLTAVPKCKSLKKK